MFVSRDKNLFVFRDTYKCCNKDNYILLPFRCSLHVASTPPQSTELSPHTAPTPPPRRPHVAPTLPPRSCTPLYAAPAPPQCRPTSPRRRPHAVHAVPTSPPRRFYARGGGSREKICGFRESRDGRQEKRFGCMEKKIDINKQRTASYRDCKPEDS